MKIDDFIRIINDCCNDVSFSFNGKSAGIIPEVNNYKKTYHVWHGDKTKDYSNVDDVMKDDFFDGCSLREIYSKVQLQIS
jgi:hypothetical protein